MDIDPSAVLLTAVIVVGTLITAEAYLTYRDWWRRWRASQVSRSTWPARSQGQAVRRTPSAIRRPTPDDEEQSPYGKGNFLIS